MQLNLARYQWQLPDQQALAPNLKSLIGSSYPAAFLRLVQQRGLTSQEAIEVATQTQPTLYHDPFLMHDMDRVVRRLETAIANQERIIIYGDYDADGITATLILLEGLELIGANVDYYLPNRHIDGYGPNLDRYRQLIEEGAELILTCDNGVAGYEAIDYANSVGIDVIVTDHHEIQSTLPNAYAVVHPAHPEGRYPFAYLSGAGVALKVISALTGEVPQDLMDLAAIGTVADMVDLTDENRTIVLAGLQQIRQTERIGLRQLIKQAGANITNANAQTIGFIIGPRLNALGRLGDPTPGIRLLATFDEAEATELANYVEERNTKRKNIVNQMMGSVNAQLANLEEIPPILILAHPDWPAGVLGIAAGRVAQEYQRPTILCQYLGEENLYKGSGRSVDGVDLFEWLSTNQSFLKYFGGHEQAAGMTIDANHWEDFVEAMQISAEPYLDVINQPPQLKIDLVLTTDEITEDFVDQVNQLGPFGIGNPEPLVLVKDATLNQVRIIGKDQTHLKLAIQSSDTTTPLQTIGFGQADQGRYLKVGQKVSVVGKVGFNEWNGQRMVQLMQEDLGIATKQWIDVRGSRIPNELMKQNHTVYLYQHQRLADTAKNRLDATARIGLYGDTAVESDLTDFNKLVIMEPPKDMDLLTDWLDAKNWSQIYLGSFLQTSKYLIGLPSREETVKFYKYQISQKESYFIRDRLDEVAKQLDVHVGKIKLLYLMFFEAEFVTIENGRISNVNPPKKEKVDLTELSSYRQFKAEIEIERLLNYASLAEVASYFEGEK